MYHGSPALPFVDSEKHTHLVVEKKTFSAQHNKDELYAVSLSQLSLTHKAHYTWNSGLSIMDYNSTHCKASLRKSLTP